MTPEQALAFVEEHGVVLQAARGAVPSFAQHVAGEPIRGSWWAHPKGHQIFELASAVSEHPDVLVCKLVDGKITYVHRRLWAALVKLAARFDDARLARVAEEHTERGRHRALTTPYPEWVPKEVTREANALSTADAERLLAAVLPTEPPKAR